MKKIANFQLKAVNAFEAGTEVSIMDLFSSEERFRFFEIFENCEENSTLKFDLDGYGELFLSAGSDFYKGDKKTLMTVLWYNERAKVFRLAKNIEKGSVVDISITKD